VKLHFFVFRRRPSLLDPLIKNKKVSLHLRAEIRYFPSG
jgi:hypothetical protein